MTVCAKPAYYHGVIRKYTKITPKLFDNSGLTIINPTMRPRKQIWIRCEEQNQKSAQGNKKATSKQPFSKRSICYGYLRFLGLLPRKWSTISPDFWMKCRRSNRYTLRGHVSAGLIRLAKLGAWICISDTELKSISIHDRWSATFGFSFFFLFVAKILCSPSMSRLFALLIMI